MKRLKRFGIIMMITMGLVGCNSSSNPTGEAQPTGEIEPRTNLGIIENVNMEYAKSFSATKLEEGYVLINLENEDDLLLVPEGKEAIQAEGIRDVQMPIQSIAATSTTEVAFIKALGQEDKIKGVTTDKGDWYIPGIDEMIENGQIKFLGKSAAMDYEALQEIHPDIVLVVSSRTDSFEKMRAKLTELGFAWTNVANNIENDPRGRIEWVKFFGLITQQEEAANKYFAQELEKIAAVEKETQKIEEKPTVAYFRISEDGYTIKKADDYSVKMIELAGGQYAFPDVEPGKTGITKVSPEEFYAMAQNVDILIHENMGTYILTQEELFEHGDFLKDLKAVQDGKIWTTNKNYWQSLDKAGDMIVELNKIIQGDQPEAMSFYSPMK